MKINENILYFDNEKIDKEATIRLAGEKLYEHGFIEREYIESMVEKEKTDDTYIGNNVAIPHGVADGKKFVKESGIVILHFRDSIDYDGRDANIIIGIAGKDGDHLSILADIAINLSSEEKVKSLINAPTKEEFLSIFNN